MKKLFKVRKKRGVVLLEQLYGYVIGVAVMGLAIVFIVEVINKVEYNDRLFGRTYNINNFILDTRKDVRNAQNISLSYNQLTLKYSDGTKKIMKLIDGSEFGHLEVNSTKLFNVIYDESSIVIEDGILNIELESIIRNRFGTVEKCPIDVNIALR